MPPCAQRVEPASSSALVTNSTRPAARACRAAVKPAMPLPTTTTSAVANQPGAAARKRLAITGTASRVDVSRIDGVPANEAGVRERLGRGGTRGGEAVVRVDEHDLWPQIPRLGVGHRAVADDDDEVAFVHQPRGGTVDADDTGASGAGDDVGLQPGAVVDVDDGHLLAGQQIGRVHQVL